MGRSPFSVQRVVATQPALPDVVLYYDYNRLDESVRAEAQALAREIKRAGQRIQSDLLLIASNLLEAKERNLFPTAEWQNWVREEFGIEPRRAQMMMNVARVYRGRDDAPEVLSTLGDTVVMMVSQPTVPESVRREIEQLAAEQPLTSRVAKRLIRKLTLQEATALVEQALDQMDPLEQQRVLNGSTHQIDPYLPSDVKLSKDMLRQAVNLVRRERLAAIMPEEVPEVVLPAVNWGNLLDVAPPAPVEEPVRLPDDLAAAGWELHQVAGTDKWYAVHRQQRRATSTFVRPDQAIEAAYAVQVDLRPQEPAPLPDLVQVTLPRAVAEQLLQAVADKTLADLPGETLRALRWGLADALDV